MWLLATFIAGALSTGLWERVLGPAFNWAGTVFSSVMARVFHGYLDMLYGGMIHSADRFGAEAPALVLLALFSIGSLAAVVRLLLAHRLLENLKKGRLPQRWRWRSPEAALSGPAVYATAIVGLLASVAYAQFLFLVVHAGRAAAFAERSIRIVAPYISPEDVVRLDSQYESVRSAADFYQLEDRLRAIAREHNLKLPPFASIR